MSIGLEHDHSKLDELLSNFFAALARADVDQSYKTLDRFWVRLAVHIRAEHLHLFPALLRAGDRPAQPVDHLPSPELIRQTVIQLRQDHDFFMSELTAAMKQLRELRRSGRRDASVLGEVRKKTDAVAQRLASHNEREETGLYRWAPALLGPSECAVLVQKMEKELRNLPPHIAEQETF